MSKFDKLALPLRPCCVATVQRQTQLGTNGETMRCLECGTKLAFKSGRWGRASQASFAR